MQTRGQPNQGKKKNGQSGDGGRRRTKKSGGGRRAQASRPQIETIELISANGGYAYAFTTMSGVKQQTNVFALEDGGKRLRAIADEYHVPRKLFNATLNKVREIQNDVQINVCVQTKLAQIASDNEFVNVNGQKMYLVPTAQLRDGGQITFGDDTFVLANLNAAINDDATPEPKTPVVTGSGNGETHATP